MNNIKIGSELRCKCHTTCRYKYIVYDIVGGELKCYYYENYRYINAEYQTLSSSETGYEHVAYLINCEICKKYCGQTCK